MLPVLSSASRLVGSTGNDYNYIDNISSVHNIDLNDENVSDSSITSKIKSVDHDSGNFRNLSWFVVCFHRHCYH